MSAYPGSALGRTRRRQTDDSLDHLAEWLDAAERGSRSLPATDETVGRSVLAAMADAR